MKGNVNQQMGAMHKELMANRLGNEEDPLTLEVIQTVCPDAVQVVSVCVLKPSEGTTERASEMGLMWEAKDSQGKTLSGQCDVATKSCTGFGTSNQLARFWLNDILTPEELTTPVGKALEIIAGTAGKGSEINKSLIPGQLSTGSNAKTFGRPLMCWLGEEENTQRILQEGFGKADTKVLLLTMRGAGEQGEDIHVAVESTKLLNVATAEAIKTTSKGENYVPIMPSDNAIDFSRALSLKRKGGDAGADSANQLQLVLRTKGLLEMALENKAGVKTLDARVSYEVPSLTSQAIANLAGKDNLPSEDDSLAKRRIWKQLGQQANYMEQPQHGKVEKLKYN